jgi:hypothetical protein
MFCALILMAGQLVVAQAATQPTQTKPARREVTPDTDYTPPEPDPAKRPVRPSTAFAMPFAHPVDYFISLEVKGQDHVQSDSDSKIGFTDWYFATSLGRFGEIRFGKVKEPFVYEVVGDAANLQQQERILTPAFIPTRNIGLRARDRPPAVVGGWLELPAPWCRPPVFGRKPGHSPLPRPAGVEHGELLR